MIVPILYAFEREPGSDRVIIHRANATYPGTDAETKCRPGEVRKFVSVGASGWPRAHDLVVRHFSGVPTRTCQVCFPREPHSAPGVSPGGVVLRGAGRARVAYTPPKLTVLDESDPRVAEMKKGTGE